MEIYWLYALLIICVVDWFAVAKKIKNLEYICKPAVMLVLFIFLFLSTHFENGSVWFALGVFFSLVGDIFLMLPKSLFTEGLVFFLLAHLSYITGFNCFDLNINLASVLILLMIGVSSYTMFRLVTSQNIYFNQVKSKIPVLLYIIAISVMLFCAALTLTSDAWLFIPSLMVTMGAFLFYISDSMVAINRYLPDMQISRVISMMAYHIGQGLIIIGVVYQTTLSAAL